MMHLRSFGLIAVAAVALMTFAAGASADYVKTTTSGDPSTPTIHAVNENGHVTLQNPVANISCSSTAEGNVEAHGAGDPAAGEIDHLTFTGCTNSWHVTALDPGWLEVDWTSGHNGTVFSDGAVVHATRFTVVSCVYETFETHIGTVTGGNPATLHIEAEIPINVDLSSPLCGSSDAKWEGEYVTTSALYVGNS